VRGKTDADTEFGAKIREGYAFLEDLSWEAFNEGTRLLKVVEQYKTRLGYYPRKDCWIKYIATGGNREKLSGLGITLVAKSLGRPKAVKNHIRPSERNSIE
jgi:hypothetical protein